MWENEEIIDLKKLILHWWDELLPRALYVGLSPEQFWFDEPYLLISYFKSHELKLKNNAEEWKSKTNFKAWLEGIYVQNAVASVLSKGHSYPSKPFELFDDENKAQNQSILENEKAIKERSKAINQMLNKR